MFRYNVYHELPMSAFVEVAQIPNGQRMLQLLRSQANLQVRRNKPRLANLKYTRPKDMFQKCLTSWPSSSSLSSAVKRVRLVLASKFLITKKKQLRRHDKRMHTLVAHCFQHWQSNRAVKCLFLRTQRSFSTGSIEPPMFHPAHVFFQKHVVTNHIDSKSQTDCPSTRLIFHGPPTQKRQIYYVHSVFFSRTRGQRHIFNDFWWTNPPDLSLLVKPQLPRVFFSCHCRCALRQADLRQAEAQPASAMQPVSNPQQALKDALSNEQPDIRQEMDISTQLSAERCPSVET